jgi:hypothetical protein
MTLSDIDDAMGWAPGTARRRRWRALDHGGLPNADAEIGGIALWFRRTIEAWRAAPKAAPRTRRARDAEPPQQEPISSSPPDDVTSQGPGAPEPEGRPAGSSPDEAAEPPDQDLPPAVAAAGSMEIASADADPEPVAVEPEGQDDPTSGTPPAGDSSVVTSGYDLVVGQNVLADVHGRWRDAVVAHRDRTTVMVEYQLDDTPLGARRQRIGTDRVRILTDSG